MNTQQMFVTALLSFGLLFAGDAWSAQAGLVQFVHGDVRVTDLAGHVHVMQKGQPVNEGDTVASAQTASAQIKMRDGGFVAIRPDTRLKFDSFKFSKEPDKPESAFFSLFKGGFRAITGLIGRIRHQDYKITTPVATIGIRGTDHETVMVLPDDPLVLAGQAAPGAYNKVNVGETSIATKAGTVVVLANQMGFAGGANQMPQIQPINTNLFTVTPAPAPGAGMGGGNGESAPRDTAVVDPTGQIATGGSQTPTGLPSTAPPSVVINSAQTLAPTLPTQGAGGIAYFPVLCDCISPSPISGIAQYSVNAAGDMNGFSATDPIHGSAVGSIGSASIVATGGNLLAGNLNWGRWAGTGASISFAGAVPVVVDGYLDYIGGDIPTMPVTGIASYAAIGGTAPIDVHGNTGQFLGADLSVNFQTATLNVNSLNVGFGGNTFSISGSGTFHANGVIPSFSMSGTCAGATCATVANYGTYGSVAGAFTGTNAAGLGLAYQVMSYGTSGSVSLLGTQGFIKQ